MTHNIVAHPSHCNTASHDRRMARKLKSKRQLRLEMDLAGIQQKALAISLDMDQAQLSRTLSDGCMEEPLVSDLPGITREVGPAYMQWVAMQCGGTYHHGEQAQASTVTPAVLVALLARGSGDTISQLVQDLQDNHWSAEERMAQLPGLRKLLAVVEALLRQAEGGVK